MLFENKHIRKIGKRSTIGNYARKADLVSSIGKYAKTKRIADGFFDNSPRYSITPIRAGNKIMNESDVQFVMIRGYSVRSQTEFQLFKTINIGVA